MRFKLALEVINKHGDNLLPLNYQYELSSWIYRVLNHGDADFATWLHREGYTDNKKRFKLFTFSNLIVEEYIIHNDRLKITSPGASLYISFYPVGAITPFITGLFKSQEFSLGDRISKVGFIVRGIEKQGSPEFKDKMKFRCISPLIISCLENGRNRNQADYLYPEGERYNELFGNNLVQKYNVFYKEAIGLAGINFKLEIASIPKSRLITIKAFTPEESKLKGYLYEFIIHAPKELTRLGYYAGFGEKNSLGFGCVEETAH